MEQDGQGEPQDLVEQWEKAAGVACPNCGRATWRLCPLLKKGKTGCPVCAAQEREKLAKAEEALGPAADSLEATNPRLARRMRRYLKRRMVGR